MSRQRQLIRRRGTRVANAAEPYTKLHQAAQQHSERELVASSVRKADPARRAVLHLESVGAGTERSDIDADICAVGCIPRNTPGLPPLR